MADRNKNRLLELLKEPGNGECADCGDPLGVQENGERQSSSQSKFMKTVV